MSESPVPQDLALLLNTFQQPAAVLTDDYRIIATNKSYQSHYHSLNNSDDQYCYSLSHGYSSPCDLHGESCPLKLCQTTARRQRVLHLHNTSRGQEHVDVEMIPLQVTAGQPALYLELMHLVKVADAHSSGEGLVGHSHAFNQMLNLIQRAAPSEISVLLHGETGTGKELVAKALHVESKRSQSPFVTVECSGLTESLFESEMFGHEKGAFTGAVQRREGLVSAARGGTLFLDEVGDIPLSLQVKLLRLIESKTFRRVGGNDLQHADFRLVCASHKNLLKMVDAGEFREDLYYRISSFPIVLPALKDRTDDVPLLINTLLKRISGGSDVSLSAAALSSLVNYPFPGNIRELRNVLERAVLLADGQVIEREHLPESVNQCVVGSIEIRDGEGASPELIPLHQLEGRYLAEVRHSFKGHNKELAQGLGVSERTLYRKLSKL